MTNGLEAIFSDPLQVGVAAFLPRAQDKQDAFKLRSTVALADIVKVKMFDGNG